MVNFQLKNWIGTIPAIGGQAAQFAYKPRLKVITHGKATRNK
jgi:hypothetical protein